MAGRTATAPGRHEQIIETEQTPISLIIDLELS
jgi:hypothetical protein